MFGQFCALARAVLVPNVEGEKQKEEALLALLLLRVSVYVFNPPAHENKQRTRRKTYNSPAAPRSVYSHCLIQLISQRLVNTSPCQDKGHTPQKGRTDYLSQ